MFGFAGTFLKSHKVLRQFLQSNTDVRETSFQSSARKPPLQMYFAQHSRLKCSWRPQTTMWIIALPIEKKLESLRMLYNMCLILTPLGEHTATKAIFQSYVQEFAKPSFQSRSTQSYTLVWILLLYRASWVPLRYYRDTRASSNATIYRQKAWFSSGTAISEFLPYPRNYGKYAVEKQHPVSYIANSY